MRFLAPALCVAIVCTALPVRAQWPAPRADMAPHPAVVRVVVPEKGGTAYGSGTLVDLREEYGLVLTNWHVVRDAVGPIEVLFPSGFRSQARSLKVDSEWDLAALVIWRPPTDPAPLATQPPRPGDRLTICGYGQGDYRAVTGRCTQFYSPRLDLPRELVELDVEARQGDSGGPIFNDRGELAGVLFGAAQGTTLGSFEGRVKTFLASLAPDIGASDTAPQVALNEPGRGRFRHRSAVAGDPAEASDLANIAFGRDTVAQHKSEPRPTSNTPTAPANDWPPSTRDIAGANGERETLATDPNWPRFQSSTPTDVASSAVSKPEPIVPANWFEQLKNVLAIIGAVAIVLVVMRIAR